MIRWTGRGWVGALLWLTIPVLALAIAARTPSFVVWFAVLNTAIGVPLHIVVGRALNTRQTPEGRERTLEHSLQSMPVDRAWFWYPLWSLIAVGALFWTRGDTAVVWVLGIVALIGLIVHIGWATREYRAAAMPLTSSPDGELIADRAVGADGGPARTPVAEKAFEATLHEIWSAYGAEVDQLSATTVTTGTVDGMRFTVFNLTDASVGLRRVLKSMRTVCMVHLPVALPDVRLRPRLLDEDEIGEIPAVSLEPPWNCDLLVRARAVDALEGDPDPGAGLTAESDVAGLAEALVTPEVIQESVRAGVIHWRVHGRELIYVGFPGFGLMLKDDESAAVVAGLVRIAKAVPQEALQRYGIRPAAPG